MVQTTRLSVGGMSCGACIGHVTRALDGLKGVVHVDIDLEKNEATVEHQPDWVGETRLVAAIKDAGYQAKVMARDAGGTDVVERSARAGCSTGCCCGQ